MAAKKKTAARTPKAASEEADTSIFEHFGLAETPAQGVQKATKTEKGADPALEAFEARMKALEDTLKDKDRTIAALLTNPATVVDTSALGRDDPAPGVDLKGLPDPVIDPEGHEKALSERISKAISDNIAHDRRARDAENRASSTQASRTENLWERFGDKYEDLAEDPDIVELAATKAAKAAEAKGMDLQRYIFGAGDTFLDDVATRVRGLRSKMGLDADDEPGGVGGASDEDEGEEEVRTQGIFGGVESGGKPAPGAKPPGGTMIDDLQAIQRRTGFF